jgi:hypothetical protein
VRSSKAASELTLDPSLMRVDACKSVVHFPATIYR